MAANEVDSRLEMTVEWTLPGEQLIANEQFAYFSPLWLSTQRGGNLHPFSIKSVGLTQEPNIQFLAVACEELNETPNPGGTMNLLERLRALINKEEVQTEDDVVGFVQKMLDALKALRESMKDKWKAEDVAYDVAENERLVKEAVDLFQTLEGDLATANEAVPESAAATLTQVQTELATANESLATMRTAHCGLLLDGALADGRITPATRQKWEERFGAEESDFTALANELAGIDPTMKTSRKARDGKPNDGGTATHADVVALANELKGPEESFESAYGRVKKEEKFAHLFNPEHVDA